MKTIEMFRNKNSICCTISTLPNKGLTFILKDFLEPSLKAFVIKHNLTPG